MFDPRNVRIPALDEAAMRAAELRQAALAKPPHSLGRLEEISVRFAGVTGRVFNAAKRRRVAVFCADNGVAAEGVASAPQSVTLAQTINFARGLTGCAVLCRHYHTELIPYDVGINAEFSHSGVIDRKIAMGTRNIALEPAMSRGELLRAMEIGFEAAADAKADSIEILGVGEMGIGNTTTSAAVLACLLGLPVSETVGRGGGVSDAGFRRKAEVIEAALRLYAPDPDDPMDVLQKVGGFDLAAMCGAYLGAAANRLPVVIDGYISAVAALCAVRLKRACREYLFASHRSCERGYLHAMEAMHLTPMFDLEMRLGEGSGCPIAFEIIDSALTVLREMATFEEARIDDGYLAEIRADARLQR